jgi:uncharacterized membrane protein YoaK (UPF0700 family)
MTNNTTQLSIDVTDVVLSWHWNRRNASATSIGNHMAARRRLMRLASIMLGFLSGTLAGGVAYISVGLACLLLPIGIVAALAVWAQSQTR